MASRYPAFIPAPGAPGPRPACEGKPQAWWFPERGQSPDRAKAVCGGCAFLVRCRTWALNRPAVDVWGVWGGLSEGDRERIHQQRRRGVAA